MANRDFILQRISVFAGQPIDPNADQDVENMLRDNFNIRLPQRTSFDDSLTAANSEHDILKLIIQYRQMGA